MPKSIRIRTQPGKEQNIHVKLEQDFDLLEVLSLKMTQDDVYSRMCGDYGVVVGRVLANGGFGVPNAKVSVFIPLTDEDEQDEVIKSFYPYKEVTDKDEEGYKYNLLPQEKQSCNHSPTGTFPLPDEILNIPTLLEVYKKYYKYTTKTNESGDFMIWGVPLGNQTIHCSVDVSDIGCYSMHPYDFINQGKPLEEFVSALEFNTSENLDSLPQIILQNKTLEVVPFWGDDDLCNVGITRVDFDLRDSSVEIVPSATFIGSIITDDDSNYVDSNGLPSKYIGNLCNLTTGTGLIETIRETIQLEDDGCTPKLEKFPLKNGGKVIDGNGAWVTQLPMNLDFIITNEYGEQVISDNPNFGIPTRAKYRFRIGFDNKGSTIRNGNYLVPNLREYSIANPQPSDYAASYVFSTNYSDYPEMGPVTFDNTPAYNAEDYFYEFRPNRVYTISSFIDNYRKTSQRGDTNNRWRFLGIKGINPPTEQRCTDITKEFPSNDVFRGGSFLFGITQTQLIIQQITILLTCVLVAFNALSMLMNAYNMALQGANASTWMSAAYIGAVAPWDTIIGAALGSAFLAAYIATAVALVIMIIFFYSPLFYILVNNFKIMLKLTRYPDCEPCVCEEDQYEFKIPIITFFVGDDNKISEDTTDAPDTVPECTMNGFSDNAFYWQGKNGDMPKGCYKLQFRNGVWIVFYSMMVVMGVLVWVPWGGTIALNIAAGVLATLEFGLIIDNLWKMFVSLNQWRVLKNIYNGLCQGVFNMKFSNGWINGTLYHFKFKRVKDEADVTNDDYPQKLVHQHVELDSYPAGAPTGNVFFYYRSCPYLQALGFQMDNTAVDGDDGWNHKGINYPTTITELGPLDECTNQLCNEELEDCYFVDKLAPSSYQYADYVLGKLIEQKIEIQSFSNFIWSGVNKFFGADGDPSKSWVFNDGNRRWGSPDMSNMGYFRARPARLIDGDISALIATNNQLGVEPYLPGIDNPYYPATLPTSQITPISTPLNIIMNDPTLVGCLQGGPFGIDQTQLKPFYPWRKVGALPYGGWNSDWSSAGSQPSLSTTGNQQGTVTPAPEPPIPGTQMAPPRYWQTTGNQLENGNYGLSPAIPTPPTGGIIKLGTHQYFYFGLRQGSTAYDIFLNKYLKADNS